MPGPRNPDRRRVRRSRAYSVPETAALLDVHPHTVRRWIGDGLEAMGGGKRTLIHGTALARFLADRRQAVKRKCAPDEMYCFACRAPRQPLSGSVAVVWSNEKTLRLKGLCGVCGASLCRSGSLAKRAEYAAVFGFDGLGTPRLEGRSVPLSYADFKEDKKDG